MVNESVSVNSKLSKHKAVRILFFIVGSVSLFLGVIGIFLPLLPTTPFLLLTAACYLRSSERMYNWLLNNRWFGNYIKNYQEGRGIPLKTKIFAITVLWFTILLSVIFMINKLWFVPVILIVLAIGVSLHLIRLPTFKK
jgi:uncharacterized membrane protein YbaN (DUF454 family)